MGPRGCHRGDRCPWSSDGDLHEPHDLGHGLRPAAGGERPELEKIPPNSLLLSKNEDLLTAVLGDGQGLRC